MAKLSNRLTSALAPLGVVALVAGCGGGSMVAGGNGSTTFVPPGQTTAQTSKATLTLYVPARKGSANARSPRYVSPGTSTVTVAVAQAGAPSPWPNPTSTSVPTPGSPPPTGPPTPIPVTMTVNAPVGNAQFAVNTYDSAGHLLSGVTSTPVPISSNATANTITLTLNAAAECMQVNHGKATLALSPLENQSGTQTATFVVTPCDIDGYVIPAGQLLGNALVFTSTNPNQSKASVARNPLAAAGTPTPAPTPTPLLSFSPNAITAGGDTTVTVTYAAGASGAETQYIVPSDALNVGGTVPTIGISANPLYDVLVSNRSDDTVSVLEFNANGAYVNNPGAGVAAPTVSLPAGSGPSQIGGARNGCGQGGRAITTNDKTHTIGTLSIPFPGPMTSPNPVPNVGSITGVAGSASTLAVGGCTVYIGFGSYLQSLALSSFSLAASANGPYSNPANGQAATPAAVTAAAAIGSSVYVGLGPTGGYLNYIVDIANGSLYPGFAAGTDAMSPYDASHVAIAYHGTANGYLHFALFDGTGLTNDVGYTSAPALAGMAVDSSGNVDAITTTGQILQYVPSTNSVAAYGPNGALYPTGIAIRNTTIFVSDTGGGTGAGSVYVYPCAACGPTSYPVGGNPSGITIVP